MQEQSESVSLSGCCSRSEQLPAVGRTVPERAVESKMIFFGVGPGLVRSGSAWRNRLFLLGRWSHKRMQSSLAFFLGFVSVVVATGSCNRSCPTRLLPNHSFARYRSRHA